MAPLFLTDADVIRHVGLSSMTTGAGGTDASTTPTTSTTDGTRKRGRPETQETRKENDSQVSHDSGQPVGQEEARILRKKVVANSHG